MKTFKVISEISKYFNIVTNCYEFVENGKLLDVKFEFALNIKALNIDARNIKALNIDAHNIKARNIDALNIDAHYIKAHDIDAHNIKALNIDAHDIKALNIKALNIDAHDISIYAFCVSYKSLKCLSISSRRENSIYKCLDGNIEFKKKTFKITIADKEIELSEESYFSLKKQLCDE